MVGCRGIKGRLDTVLLRGSRLVGETVEGPLAGLAVVGRIAHGLGPVDEVLAALLGQGGGGLAAKEAQRVLNAEFAREEE